MPRKKYQRGDKSSVHFLLLEHMFATVMTVSDGGILHHRLATTSPTWMRHCRSRLRCRCLAFRRSSWPSGRVSERLSARFEALRSSTSAAASDAVEGPGAFKESGFRHAIELRSRLDQGRPPPVASIDWGRTVVDRLPAVAQAFADWGVDRTACSGAAQTRQPPGPPPTARIPGTVGGRRSRLRLLRLHQRLGRLAQRRRP